MAPRRDVEPLCPLPGGRCSQHAGCSAANRCLGAMAASASPADQVLGWSRAHWLSAAEWMGRLGPAHLPMKPWRQPTIEGAIHLQDDWRVAHPGADPQAATAASEVARRWVDRMFAEAFNELAAAGLLEPGSSRTSPLPSGVKVGESLNAIGQLVRRLAEQSPPHWCLIGPDGRCWLGPEPLLLAAQAVGESGK